MASIAVDSSTLISLSQTGLDTSLEFLSRHLDGKFLIPPAVRHEIIVHPMHVRRYELSALRLGKLVETGVLQVCEPPGLHQVSIKLKKIANNLIFAHGRPLELIQQGELECLALICLNQVNAIAIDEKTTRLLLESPSTLLERAASEFNSRVSLNDKSLRAWNALVPKTTVIRSSELIAVAARKGYFSQYGNLQQQAVEASMAALRNGGCSLTENEINEYLDLEH